MLAPQEESYPNSKDYLLIMFDIRVPGTKNRLMKQKRSWGDDARIEYLADGHVALVVRPGGAWRLLVR